MSRLLKAFFYKISKDITFRITLIVGAGVAIFMILLYFLLDLFLDAEGMKMLTGQSMLVTSFSPAQNFGIAIPINVVSFVILEFTQGTIRNKIIAGHSKFKIYASLYLSGLVLAFSLLLMYVGVCTLFGTIIGGFDLDVATMVGTGMGAKLSVEFIIKYVVIALLTYTSLVSFAVFVATLFRSMGPCIPLVMIGIFGLYFLAVILSTVIMTTESIIDGCNATIADATLQLATEADPEKTKALELSIEMSKQTIETTKPTVDTLHNVENIVKCVDPLYAISSSTIKDGVATIDNYTFFTGIGSNIFYAAAFFIGGACLFKKRDVK